MAKHSLYDESPKMERGEEGKMGVKKTEKEHPEGKEHKSDGSADLAVHEEHAGERLEMRHRHVREHIELHTKHAMEHLHSNGDKKAVHEKHLREHDELHTRHHKEMKDMFTRHEKEAGKTAGSKDVGEPIAKIEKDSKGAK